MKIKKNGVIINLTEREIKKIRKSFLKEQGSYAELKNKDLLSKYENIKEQVMGDIVQMYSKGNTLQDLWDGIQENYESISELQQTIMGLQGKK